MKIERNDLFAFYATCVFVAILVKGFKSIPEYPAGSESGFMAVVGVISIATIVSVVLYIFMWGITKLLINKKNVA